MDQQQWASMRPAIAKLRASIMGIVFGTLGGFALAGGTAWLLIRGGHDVGAHLSLLGNYYPGYTVTWGGVVLGFIYGALTGGFVGYTVSWIYNTIALKRLDQLSK
jgi:hypothetical protein